MFFAARICMSKKVRIQSKPEQEMMIAGKGENGYIVREENRFILRQEA
jgi:hypothetical protein